MHTNITVKRHPVINRCFIICTTQYCISGLIGQAEYSGRCHAVSFTHIAGYKICLQNNISILEQIQMLIRQIDLNIRIADIIASFLSTFADVYRFFIHSFTVLNGFCQCFDLFLTVCLPAVCTAWQVQFNALYCGKFSLFSISIVLFCLLRYKLGDSFLI